MHPPTDTVPELLPPGPFVPYDPPRARDAAATPSARERVRAEIDAGVEAALRGETGEALRRFDAAGEALEAADHYGRLLAGINRAQALVAAGDLPAAEAGAAAALKLARREKDEHWTALAGLSLALVHLARGRRAAARKALADAARGFARAADPLRQVQAHYLLGEIAYLGDDPIRAGAHYRDGLAVARELGMLEWIELLTLRFEHR